MIQVSHLTKNYGPRTAIQGISFEVKKGEVVGFLGPNGAGKSTTMKILTGFMPATSGTATVAGHDVFTDPIGVKRNVGYLPETPPVYQEMTVKDYLEYAARLHELPHGSLSRALTHVIDKTGLGDVKSRLIGNLSKGYRQRVGLAQALIHNPKVVILDEPTVGLDPRQIIEIRELIRSLAESHTVILSSHILPEVTATCQRVIAIARGRIVASGTLDELSATMNQSTTYALQVRNASQEGVHAIRGMPGVAEVRPSSNRILIEMKTGAQDIREQVINTAVQKGMGVLEFSTQRMSLEEIYLKLTQTENVGGAA